MPGMGVSLAETLAILEGMIAEPGRVLALREISEASYGPFPFFLDDAEVTMTFDGGVIEEVVSVRIGRRFSNARDWLTEPLLSLSAVQVEALELALAGVGIRKKP